MSEGRKIDLSQLKSPELTWSPMWMRSARLTIPRQDQSQCNMEIDINEDNTITWRAVLPLTSKTCSGVLFDGTPADKPKAQALLEMLILYLAETAKEKEEK